MTYTNMESSPHDRTYKLKATAYIQEKSYYGGILISCMEFGRHLRVLELSFRIRHSVLAIGSSISGHLVGKCDNDVHFQVGY